MNEKLSQKSLTGRFLKLIQEEGMTKPGEKVLVAVSGGPDSVCLFDLLYGLQDKLQIKLAIVHYNHRLRGVESDKDEKFVLKLAKDRGVDCFVGQNPNKSKKLSELEARELRYGFFERILGEWSGNKLAVGHTLNDQAETLLLRLARGASIFGLSSIPLRRQKIIRPLLRFSRFEILNHLAAKKLKYRLDKSNQNLEFSRNLVRHKIIPELEKINSQALTHIASATEIASKQTALTGELIQQLYVGSILSEKSDSITLDAKKMADYSPLLRVELVKLAVDKLDSLTDISKKNLDAVSGLLRKNIGNKEIVLNKHLQVSLKRGIITVRKVKGKA
jgi:tRNA(Ile)-lysidine synthase